MAGIGLLTARPILVGTSELFEIELRRSNQRGGGYLLRSGRVSRRQVGEALGRAYWQAEAFLQERGLPLKY